MSLWRKRKTSDTNCDTIEPNVHYNGQNQPKWSNMTALADNDLSIKSDDLSIKLWVDPPEGWKYGFPAIYDHEKDGQLSEWIVKRGYPISLIQEYGNVWSVRCWPVEQPKGEE